MSKGQSCIVIGASHAGVNFAFALRQEGWEGKILVFDKDPELPYHRPPLSKAFLNKLNADSEKYWLKAPESYKKAQIELHLGTEVEEINNTTQEIRLKDGTPVSYDKLILATGANPLIPPIPGIESGSNIFALRSMADSQRIREALYKSEQKKVLIIGGGYIGLETAASLKRLDAEVKLLEREDRLLARVSCPELSDYFLTLHEENEVQVFLNKEVTQIAKKGSVYQVYCADESSYEANIIVLGVGIRVNLALARQAGLALDNGIKVNEYCCTSDPNIYAIGDCTNHYNPHYKRNIRLESVQNAVDQAKVAAAAICGKATPYNKIPWFWSDQYDTKLQMVGLFEGYTEKIIRREKDKENCFSIWYFKDEVLLSVDAVNNTRAYMLGTKLLQKGKKVDKDKLKNTDIALKAANFLN